MNVQNIYITFIAVVVGGAFWNIGFNRVVQNFLEEACDFDIEERWDDIPRWVKLLIKPLFACPYCMSSVHGTFIFFAFLLGYFPLIMWIPFCVILCGFTYFLTLLLE